MLNQERIMLLVTENCNLNCVYCYEHQKNSKVMSFSMAKDILDKQLSKCDPKAPVVIEVFHLLFRVCINVDGISLNGFALTLSFPVLRMEQ